MAKKLSKREQAIFNELFDSGVDEGAKRRVGGKKTNRQGRHKLTLNDEDSTNSSLLTRQPRRVVASDTEDDYQDEGPLSKRKGKQIALPSSSDDEVVYKNFKESDADNLGKKPKTRIEKENAAFCRKVDELIAAGYASDEAAIEVNKRMEKGKRKKTALKTPEAYYKAIMFNGQKGSLYPHDSTMELMGITEDVELVLGIVGVSQLATMVCPTYQEETAQFLASVELRIYDKITKSVLKRDGGGEITFTIYGKEYAFTLKEMQELYDLRSGTPSFPSVYEDELNETWEMLSGEKIFRPSRSKGNRIRNPAISYARRILGGLLFARPSPGPINLGEMEQLDIALEVIIGTLPNGRVMLGDIENSGLAGVLAQQFCEYKRRALTQVYKESPRTISVGGIVTPILLQCGVPLNTNSENVLEPRYLDVQRLRNCEVLTWDVIPNGVVYNLYHQDEEKDVKIVLPCTHLSTLKVLKNTPFLHPLSDLQLFEHEVSKPKKRPSSSKHKVTKNQDEPEPMDEDVVEPEALYFDEYENNKMGAPPREAHRRIGKLLKIGKWLVKKVRGFTNERDEWAKEREQMRKRMEELEQKFSGEVNQVPVETVPQRHSVSSLRSDSSRNLGKAQSTLLPARHSSADIGEGSLKTVRLSRKKGPRARKGESSTQPSNVYHVEDQPQNTEPIEDQPEQEVSEHTKNATLVLNSLAYTYEEMNESVNKFFSQN